MFNLPIKHIKKIPYFDVTYLEYGDDLRGIPQVILQLIKLFSTNNCFSSINFIATKKVMKLLVENHKIHPTKIEVVKLVPFFSKFDRFHGLFSNLRYRKIAKKAKWIFHPEYRTVINLKIPQIVLIHDFIFLDKPELGGEQNLSRKLYFIYKSKKAVKAKWLITVSKYTKQKTISIFNNIDPHKITVIHNGFREDLINNHSYKKTSRKIIQLLYVGAIEKRKNIFALLKNIKFIMDKHEFQFNIVGKLTENQISEMKSFLDNENLKKQIILHGRVDDYSLKNLYQQSDYFMFPSLMEGFGLPVIEAMSYGMIVFAFKNSSITEICEGNAVLAENNDFKTWKYEMQDLLHNPKRFKQLSILARNHVNNFSEKIMFNNYISFFKDKI